MEIVKRANLKSNNDRLGMLLELAVVQAIKNIPLLITKVSQFNKFYQQSRAKGPDVLFEFDDHKKTGCIECKNVNKDFKVSQDWFKKAVDKRFFPEYANLDAYIVIISQLRSSPPNLVFKLRKKYHILEVGFQITDQETYERAIPIIELGLRIITEGLKNNPMSPK